ncbi:MAG: hypothetical protein ABL872_01205 [Lacibacter sp.]
MQFSRDHDYYYNVVSNFHLKGFENNSYYSAVSIYHHFDLWCMAVVMKLTSLFRSLPGHFNYYSFISVIVVSLLSFRVWKVLFHKKIFSYSLFVLAILLVNAFLSGFTWFFDFELNGAKQSILLLLLFELVMTKNEDLKKLYFLTFISCNPLISSWFSSLILFSYLLSWIFFRNPAEFKKQLRYVTQCIILLIIFWVFFIARAVVLKMSSTGTAGIIPYNLLLPNCFTCIFSDVLFYYRFNLTELYLRGIVLLFAVLHLLLKFQDRRISITLGIYLFIDFIQAGYFGYKFFEFQQFTAIPLSFIALFLVADLLILKEYRAVYDTGIVYIRKQAGKLSGVS